MKWWVDRRKERRKKEGEREEGRKGERKAGRLNGMAGDWKEGEKEGRKRASSLPSSSRMGLALLGEWRRPPTKPLPCMLSSLPAGSRRGWAHQAVLRVGRTRRERQVHLPQRPM